MCLYVCLSTITNFLNSCTLFSILNLLVCMYVCMYVCIYCVFVTVLCLEVLHLSPGPAGMVWLALDWYALLVKDLKKYQSSRKTASHENKHVE